MQTMIVNTKVKEWKKESNLFLFILAFCLQRRLQVCTEFLIQGFEKVFNVFFTVRPGRRGE